MRVPAVMMRGGTSRGLFFKETDLPPPGPARDALILSAYGSPDPRFRQINGIGGGTSVTSKTAIIGAARGDDHDVTYTFGQVSIDGAMVDYAGTCGNMSSAVGPFAYDEGMVAHSEGNHASVRVLSVNTGQIFLSRFPVHNGKFDSGGDFAIPGVPGTGSLIELTYLDPGGAVTGDVLPTGNAIDTVVVGDCRYDISIVDVANPLVFIGMNQLGLTGTESPDQLDGDHSLLQTLLGVRAEAAVLAGIARTREDAALKFPSVPKVAMVSEPVSYVASSGERVGELETTLRVVMLSMGRIHPSIAVTGAICVSAAANLDGTVANIVARDDRGGPRHRIGHPAGVMDVAAEPLLVNDEWVVPSVTVYRTARRLFEGAVCIDIPA